MRIRGWLALCALMAGCSRGDYADIFAAPLSDGAGNWFCVPGDTHPCMCPIHDNFLRVGRRTCVEDGSGHGPCVCSPDEGGAGGISTGGGGDGGDLGDCTDHVDCLQPDNECVYSFCSLGKCTLDFFPKGTSAQTQVPGDCSTLRCDGEGNAVPFFTWSDEPADPLGDCAALVCDTHVKWVVSVYDDTDMQDDGIQCTIDTCSMMGTIHEPATGTLCNEGGGSICRAGDCVAFIPVKCSVDDTGQIYEGCDGQSHPGVSITWGGPTPGSCEGGPDDVGYCPLGESCEVSENGGEVQLGTCL